MKFNRRKGLSLLAGLALIGAAGCAGEAAVSNPDPREFAPTGQHDRELRVSVDEEMFHLASSRVSAGRIAFIITNTGLREHEFILVPRSGERYGMPLAHFDLDPGQVRGLEVTLDPGNYEIACLATDQVEGLPAANMRESMHVALEVAR